MITFVRFFFCFLFLFLILFSIIRLYLDAFEKTMKWNWKNDSMERRIAVDVGNEAKQKRGNIY